MQAGTTVVMGLGSVNKSPRAAKAQDCSAVSPWPQTGHVTKRCNPSGGPLSGFAQNCATFNCPMTAHGSIMPGSFQSSVQVFPMKRPSGRAADQLRSIRITRNYTKHAEGSVLVEFGDTKVICTVSVENGVPRFLKGQGQGWLTAEYGMLPRATGERNQREASRGKQGGRTL